jgi:1,4-dihydroxy-2-naphthoate octaprenyltransferase
MANRCKQNKNKTISAARASRYVFNFRLSFIWLPSGLPMFENLKLLKTTSRPEFLPANLSSLVMGLAWSLDPAQNWRVLDTALLAGLVLAVLTFVSAIGAQLNTLSDHELDSKEPRKQYLVKALDALGQGKLRRILILEFLMSLPFFIVLIIIQPKPALVLLWIFGHFLAYAYSVAPIRLKSRSWLAMISLLLALSILPVSFVYLTFSNGVMPLFVLFLAGQAMSVYAVIVPTETRDYWIDKANGVETMTVWLGLVKASILAIGLLSVGGVLMGVAFALAISVRFPVLAVFLPAIFAADFIILRSYRRLYALSKKYSSTKDDSVAGKIVELSARNPRWINLAQQSILITSLVLLAAKLLS